MARQKCRGCGQFAGSFHKCPALQQAAPAKIASAPALPVATPKARKKAVTAADVQRVKGLSDLQIIQASVWMEQAMAPATGAGSNASRENTRKMIEAQFGSVDWSK